MAYADLAEKYESTIENVRDRYSNAVKRIIEILRFMDEKADSKKEFYAKQVAERSGHMPKGQRWFLLNKLFGIPPADIAEMEGMERNNSTVRQLIIRVSDQIRAGEINLIETTPYEADKSKLRLDNQRKVRRKRYRGRNKS
jgi:hypothetical protein